MTERMDSKPKQQGDRTPIRIEKLLIAHANAHGVNLPDGIDGKSQRLNHTVKAGIEGDVKTDIEHRPWLRVFRVTKTKRVTRTEGKQEVESWVPMGRPFHLPDTWAVSVPGDD